MNIRDNLLLYCLVMEPGERFDFNTIHQCSMAWFFAPKI
ncbi:hypothetical protein SATMO3_28310 [Sporomusa aerivorans]